MWGLSRHLPGTPATPNAPSPLSAASEVAPGSTGDMADTPRDAGLKQAPAPRNEKAPVDFGYVGIDSILEQMRRKAMKQGFEFNIMVVGESPPHRRSDPRRAPRPGPAPRAPGSVSREVGALAPACAASYVHIRAPQQGSGLCQLLRAPLPVLLRTSETAGQAQHQAGPGIRTRGHHFLLLAPVGASPSLQPSPGWATRPASHRSGWRLRSGPWRAGSLVTGVGGGH